MKHFSWKRMILGQFRPFELKGYVITTFVIFFSLFLLSYLSYPKSDNYAISTHMVSYLGTWSRNPNGFGFFNFSSIILGISYIPLIFYVHRRISVPRCLWFALVGTIALLISAIGIIGIGVFPDERTMSPFGATWRKIHVVFAGFAVIGFLVGLVCYSEILIEDFGAKKMGKVHYFRFRRYGVPVGLFLVVFIGVCTTQAYASVHYKPPYQGIYSKSLWEWILFITSFIEVFSFVFLLPAKTPVDINYKKYTKERLRGNKNLSKMGIVTNFSYQMH